MLDPSKHKPVVLLQPPEQCKTFTRSGSVYPPLGLCQLAATDEDDVMTVLDAEGEGMDEEATKSFLTSIKPAILGLTATSFTLELVEKWAYIGKSLGAKVIVGGPHPGLSPVSTFEECPSVDVVVRGEGEMVFQDLVRCIIENKSFAHLSGVCNRVEGGVYISSDILQVKDFDNLPFPRLDNLPIKKYWCPDAINLPMVTMMTTRGCPYRCSFCSSPAVMGKKVRGWDVEQVIKELAFLYHDLGVREISFVDDVFTINKKRTIALCEAMVKQKLNLTWFCNARADHIDETVARAMNRAGCHQAYLGFESGSQVVLDNIHKGTTVDRLVQGANTLKKYGIKRSIGFVLGLPGETNETVAMSIRLAQQLKPERLQFTRFTPLVGSPLEHFRFEENGFHNQADDKVGQWIQYAYQECQSNTWGKESW